MKFGAIPLDEAEGAILAHSVKLDRLALKKGRRLSTADVAALRAAGAKSVIAAKLEPGDVEEDEAARRVAAAVAGPHLRVDKPFTGRVNLHAEQAGVVVVDRARIDRLNLVDEAVTLGTLPAFASVRPGQMVATIKIIPFAAPQAAIERCVAIASEAGGLVRVAPYRPLDVALIQTRLPGTKESMLDKTVAITAERISCGRRAADQRSALPPTRPRRSQSAFGRAAAISS